MNKYIDITIPMKTGQLVYPGDLPCEIRRNHKICDGEQMNISFLSFSAHTGTHIDAPYHFFENGKKLHEIEHKRLIGRAKVFEFPENDICIDEKDLLDLPIENGDIVLIKTKNSNRVLDDEFFEKFVYLTGDAAEYLADKEILTFGFDYLTVDKCSNTEYPVHYTLLSKGIIIIEGLNLSEISEGEYDIIALPLKILDGDGSPARVMLRKI